MTTPARVHIDGAARGNPGPGAFAFVIERPGGPVVEESGCLGRTTNNVAEYTALVRMLEKAAELGLKHLHVLSDSELLVKQMKGEYRVKNPDLQELCNEAKDLCRRFDSVNLQHVRREQNKRADELCNVALDGDGKRPAKSSRPKPAASPNTDRVREQAIACLETAAKSWARGNAGNPPPDAIWEQLWTILEENHIVRPGPRY